MMIHVINDSNLKVPGQEPPKFFKYGLQRRGALTHFQSCYRAEICHTSKKSHIMTIHDFKDNPILYVPSQESAMSSRYGLQGRGFLTQFNNARADIWHKSQETYMMMICDIEDDLFFQIPGQVLSMSSKNHS